MSTFEVHLLTGIEVDGKSYKTAIMRDDVLADFLDATVESERVYQVQIGVDNSGKPEFAPVVLSSPTLTAVHTIRRQIVSIGPLQGPFDMVMLNKIKPEDFELIRKKVDERNAAGGKALEAVAQQGRNDTAGSDT